MHVLLRNISSLMNNIRINIKVSILGALSLIAILVTASIYFFIFGVISDNSEQQTQQALDLASTQDKLTAAEEKLASFYQQLIISKNDLKQAQIKLSDAQKSQEKLAKIKADIALLQKTYLEARIEERNFANNLQIANAMRVNVKRDSIMRRYKLLLKANLPNDVKAQAEALDEKLSDYFSAWDKYRDSYIVYGLDDIEGLYQQARKSYNELTLQLRLQGVPLQKQKTALSLLTPAHEKLMYGQQAVEERALKFAVTWAEQSGAFSSVSGEARKIFKKILKEYLTQAVAVLKMQAELEVMEEGLQDAYRPIIVHLKRVDLMLTKAEKASAVVVTEAQNAMRVADEELTKISSEMTIVIQSIKTYSDQIGVIGVDLKQVNTENNQWLDKGKILMIAIVVVLLLCIIGFIALFSRNVTTPVTRITRVMQRLAEGDTDYKQTYAGRRDEIGEMAAAVDVFKEAIIDNQKNIEIQKKRQELRQKRAESVDKLVSGFSAQAQESLDIVTDAAHRMNEMAQKMADTAQSTHSRSEEVMTYIATASDNVNIVATAAEQLSSSIQEISQQVVKSNDAVAHAVSEVERTQEIVSNLSDSSSRIDEVMTLITDIAEQTNLLALNATIEAARAGEAGRGFAVVANEVKSLASQTSTATDDISSQIHQVQNASTQAVDAIGNINMTIADMNHIMANISAAVEQQGSATSEIALNAERAARETQSVRDAIESVNQLAEDTQQSSHKVLTTSQEVQVQSDSLDKHVDDFIDGIQKTQTMTE